MEPGREIQEGKPGRVNPGAELKGTEPRGGEPRQGNQEWETRGGKPGRDLRGEPGEGPQGRNPWEEF